MKKVKTVNSRLFILVTLLSLPLYSCIAPTISRLKAQEENSVVNNSNYIENTVKKTLPTKDSSLFTDEQMLNTQLNIRSNKLQMEEGKVYDLTNYIDLNSSGLKPENLLWS